MAKPEREKKEKIRQAEREIRLAIKQIRRLEGQLNDGTLDRRKLEAGLEELGETVRNIPTHKPFMPD